MSKYLNNKLTVVPFLAIALVSSAGAVDLLVEDFSANDGGFVQEATGASPIPATYNSGSGTWSIEGDDSGPATNTITSPAITVPSTSGIQVSFDHRYSIEGGDWDGCGLQISIDGGEFKNVPASDFSQNGYTNNGPLIGNHVLTGLDGFSMESVGYGAGTFITSVASVGGFAVGSTIQVRFVGAFDEGARGAGIPNWEIDSVKVETLSDTDGDGIPDSYEDANGLDKTVNDAEGDLDSDDLSNIDEYVAGSDPQDDDSDDDGLKDGAETNTGIYVSATDTGTNPLSEDTDSDGLLDLVETNTGIFVDADDPGTNPNLADTDNDGFGDGSEIASSTDPNDNRSVPQLPEPLLYFPLDEAIGATVAVDSTGKGYDGTVVSSVTFGESGAPGGSTPSGAARFTDGILDVTTFDVPALLGNRDGAGLGDMGNYTMVAWIKPDTASLTGDRFFFGQSSQGIHNGLRNNGRLHQAHWGNDHYANTILNDTDWVHATFVYDGAADLGTIYLNGKADSDPTAKASPNGSGNLIIGGRNGGQAWYNGLIDDVAVWDSILTEAHIRALADGVKPFSPVTGDDNENGGAGDGMDDGWELANNLDPTVDDSAEDPDDDGLTNLEEWNGGETPTNPREADSDGDDLNDGEEVNTHGTNPNNADSDADGLNDGDEIAANTEPLDADTDGDEMGDGYEVDNGHDPLLAADAAEDADDDGSLNLEEYTRGTDPNKQDTDVDGIFDGAETDTGTFVSASDTGTDPLNPDTDNDGLNDGDELTAGADPFDPDTDGDTVPDGLDDDPISSGEGIGFGLVSYWPLDADLMDAVDDNHGTEEGGVIPFEAGKFNNAINLDGTQNVIITGGDESEFDFTGGSMTVSAWCTAATIDLGWQCLIAKGEGNGWRMHRRGGDVPEEFAWTGGVGDTPAHGTPIVIGGDPETWHHVVGVTDGATQIESLYIDGVEVATKTGAVLEDRGNRMRIGDNPDALGRGWNGKIDDVAIWARALPADTIAEIWADGDGTSIEVLLGGGGLGLAITDISVTTNGDVSLTWNSRSSLGTTYAVFSTDDLSLPLEDWSEIDDGVDTGGDSTTFVIPSAFLADEDKLFFFVRKN